MKKPILYVKDGCPWCAKALDFFNQHGVDIDIKDITKNKAALERMIEISDQTKAPTFEYGDFIVADFSVDEFCDALDHAPEVRKKLGIGDDED